MEDFTPEKQTANLNSVFSHPNDSLLRQFSYDHFGFGLTKVINFENTLEFEAVAKSQCLTYLTALSC